MDIENQNKKITIKEISQMAGVSISTVSRVINGNKWVNEDIRKKVLDIIEQANYTPNYNASVMAKGQSKMIVVLVATIMNPFFSQITSILIKELKKKDYFTLVFETDNSEKEEILFLNSPIARMVDGIISITDGVNEKSLSKLIKPFNNLQHPILFVDRILPTTMADCISNDYETGIGKAVENLVQNGHSKIALINGNEGFSVVQGKKTGYEKALETAGIPINPEYVREGKWSMQTGQKQTAELLDLEDPPTAIIAGNNDICNGVLEELEQRKLIPGRDISIIGTEECDADVRSFSKKKINTLSLNCTELAITASRVIIEKIENRDSYFDLHRKTLFDMAYIDRGSVARL